MLKANENSTAAQITIKEIQALVKAWRVIQHDYNDCPQKNATLDIINELIGKREDLAE